jgi:hypothetical protein
MLKVSEFVGSPSFAASVLKAIGLTLLIGGSAIACNNDRECEKARLETHRAFQSLNEVATQRKLVGVDLAKWTNVANKTELLESAFATRQVTWNSAENAKTEVQSNLSSIQTDNEVSLEIFRRTAAEAFQLQGVLADKCR